MENNLECGRRQSKTSPVTSLNAISKLEMIDILYNKYKMSKKEVTKMDRKELCSHLLKKKYSKEFYDSPLKNKRNSCYIDATLMALLHPVVTMRESNFWYNHILKGNESNNNQVNQIREELQNIVLKIHTSFRGNGGNGGNVNSLRKLFASYNHDTWNQTQRNEWLRTQMDPIDVIGMLEHIFEIPNTNVFSMGYFENGKPKKDEKVGLVGYSILPYMLERKNCKLSDFLPKYTEEHVDRSLKKSKILYVHIYRNMNGVKTNKPFTAPMEINGMQLVSAIVHLGSGVDSGHYVSMLKISKDQWVHYDDMDDKMEVFKQSDFENRSERGKMVKKSGVGFLYIQL